MTTTFDRATLLRLCSQVRPALAAQPYIPALTHIQFDGKYATAYNDVMAISVACEPGFSACVPGELMIKTLSSFKGEKVALTLGDKLLMNSERSKINLPVLPADKFVFEMPPAFDVEVKLTDEIIWGIKTCLLSVGTDDKQPARMGVTLEASRTGKATLFSTDGVTISRATTNSPVELPGGSPIILPTAFCENLVALHRAYIEVKHPILELHAGALVAGFGDSATLYSKTVIDVEPLDFDKVMRKHFDPDKATFDAVPETMVECLQRAMLMHGDDPRVLLQAAKTDGKGWMAISSKSDMGSSEDEVDWIGGRFDAVEINPQLMLRGLKSTSHIVFADSKVVVLANGDKTFMYMIATRTPKGK